MVSLSRCIELNLLLGNIHQHSPERISSEIGWYKGDVRAAAEPVLMVSIEIYCGSVHHCPAPWNVLHPACSTLALLPRPFPGLSLMPSTSGTSGLALVTAVWLEPHRWPECCTPVLGVCSLWAPERLPRVPPFFRLPGSLIILWVCVEEARQQNLPGYAPRLSSES